VSNEDELQIGDETIRDWAALADSRGDAPFLEVVNLVAPGRSADYYRGMLIGLQEAILRLEKVRAAETQLIRLIAIAERAAQLHRAAK